MGSNRSNYIQDWKRSGEKDLMRARYLLGIPDPEAAGYYLQQGLEKLMKALLLLKGWRLCKNHDLEALLNNLLIYFSHLESFRHICQKATAYYFIGRAPFIVESGVTKEDVLELLTETKGLIKFLRSEIYRTKNNRYKKRRR